MRQRWVVAAIVGTVAVGLIAAAIVLLRSPGEPLSPPAQSVQDLLELRRGRSQDASAYAKYLDNDSLATQFADLARTESEIATRPPTPAWETPYVSSESSTSAEVIVVWRDSEAYADWPKATVFTMTRSEGLWRVSDAETIEGTATVPSRP